MCHQQTKYLILLSIAFSIFSSILFTAIHAILPEHIRGFGMGIMSASLALGLTIFPIFVGLLTNHSSYRNTQILFFGMSLMSLIICVLLKVADMKSGNRLRAIESKSDKVQLLTEADNIQ